MTMKQILLAILVGIVSIGASFIDTDYEEELNGVSQHRIVSNDYCKYSEVKVQPFREITNSSLRSFLLDKLGLIANTDCVQSYRVKTNDDRSPFYVFRIDRQTKFLRSFSVCGVVTVNDGDFMWTSCNSAKFRDYLHMCESGDGPGARHPKAPPVLSCNQTTTPVPRVSPPHEDAPPTFTPRSLTSRVVTPTIPPRAVANEKSTTRNGWLSCFSCVIV